MTLNLLSTVMQNDNGEPYGYAVAFPNELNEGTRGPNSAVFLELPG
jgi:hypothetical protein